MTSRACLSVYKPRLMPAAFIHRYPPTSDPSPDHHPLYLPSAPLPDPLHALGSTCPSFVFAFRRITHPPTHSLAHSLAPRHTTVYIAIDWGYHDEGCNILPTFLTTQNPYQNAAEGSVGIDTQMNIVYSPNHQPIQGNCSSKIGPTRAHAIMHQLSHPSSFSLLTVHIHPIHLARLSSRSRPPLLQGARPPCQTPCVSRYLDPALHPVTTRRPPFLKASKDLQPFEHAPAPLP
jgi:hypothetical protein